METTADSQYMDTSVPQYAIKCKAVRLFEACVRVYLYGHTADE